MNEATQHDIIIRSRDLRSYLRNLETMLLAGELDELPLPLLGDMNRLHAELSHHLLKH